LPVKPYKNKYVPGSPGDFTSDSHPAMPVLHHAIADHDVLDGRVQPPAIVVAPGLERNAVVAGIERTPFDENVAA
jgi:hypothetical protein